MFGLMFFYYWNYTVRMGKKLQTNVKLTTQTGTSTRLMNQGQLWHHKFDHLSKTNIWQWQTKKIPNMALSKLAS